MVEAVSTVVQGDGLTDSRRMRQIGDIFDEAVNRHDAARRGYVREACRGDEELRFEVESLLEADARRSGLLDGSVWDAMDAGELEMALTGGNAPVREKVRRGAAKRVRCRNGHFFAPEEDANCPFCGVQDDHSDPAGLRDEPQLTATVPERQGGFHHEVEPVVGWLVCIEGADRGRDFRIAGRKSSIGRDVGMEIRIAGDARVANVNHAFVIYDLEASVFRLLPGDSDGSTYRNGRLVEEAATLEANDVIEIGVTKLLFIPLCGEKFRWK